MGFVFSNIELTNPVDGTVPSMPVKALVDTGAINLCIPESLAIQLKLSKLEERSVTTVGGQTIIVPYVGPVQIRFKNRSCFTGALSLGNIILLGAIPLEDLDLIVNPRLRQVTVNPESPNIPSTFVKYTRA